MPSRSERRKLLWLYSWNCDVLPKCVRVLSFHILIFSLFLRTDKWKSLIRDNENTPERVYTCSFIWKQKPFGWKSSKTKGLWFCVLINDLSSVFKNTIIWYMYVPTILWNSGLIKWQVIYMYTCAWIRSKKKLLLKSTRLVYEFLDKGEIFNSFPMIYIKTNW